MKNIEYTILKYQVRNIQIKTPKILKALQYIYIYIFMLNLRISIDNIYIYNIQVCVLYCLYMM